MNNCAFLNRIIEVYKPKQENAIKLFYHGGNVVLDINGQKWNDLTLDMVLAQVKQSLSIKYLDLIESENKQ